MSDFEEPAAPGGGESSGQSLDLALIGNCQISALLDRFGAIVWACFPAFDSPATFASLLDRDKGGEWRIAPDGGGWECESRYLPNTCVVETVWTRGMDEEFAVYDFAPRFHQHDRYYRPPMLSRIVRLRRGRPKIRVSCTPRFGFGARDPLVSRGSNHITFNDPEEQHVLRLTTNASLAHVVNGAPFELAEDKFFALAYGEPFEDSFFRLEEFLRRTISYWRGWCRQTRVPVAWQDVVLRASMALKLHTYEDTGAVIAATTTSIPEAHGTGRNWDYRYCWIRDAAFVIRTFLLTGHTEEATGFCEYLRNILPGEEDGPLTLQPVYGIDGRTALTEQTLDHLSGYRGSGPVRVGNDAWRHVQNDVYGEAVMGLAPLFYDARLLGDELEPAYSAVERLVSAAERTFEETDTGIWEYRSGNAHHSFSKLMGWCALDRAAGIAERMGRVEAAARWRQTAAEMHDRILAGAWSSELGALVGSYGGDHLDASMLLASLLRFLPADDPRMKSSVDAILLDLSRDGYMFRYRHDDGLGAQQSAFTICSTWMVEALWDTGRTDEAREMFERLLAARNSFGLLSEDIDTRTGELWGNFPQTYSMLGLINCAVRLSPRWMEIF